MKKLRIGLGCLMALAGSALAVNWTGSAANDNWNARSNWGGTVPGENDVAFIRMNANPFQNARHREVARLAIGIRDQLVNLSVGANDGSLTMGNTTSTQNNLGQHTSGTCSVTLQGGAWTANNLTLIGAGAGHTDFNVEAGTLTLANANIGTIGGTAALNIFGDAATATGKGFAFGNGGTLRFEFGPAGVSQLDLTYLDAAGATLEVDLSNYEGPNGTFTLVDANRDNVGQELNSIFSTVTLTEGTYVGSYVTQDQDSDLITVTITSAPRPEQPNLVLILADDLGWQDIKVYDLMETNVVNGFGGTNCFETPNVDQLASEGTLFTHAYSPTPVCSPSRVAIMTGKHPARTDVTSVAGGHCPKARDVKNRYVDPHYRSSLKDEDYSLAEALRDAGYFTGAFGKWHMSPDGHHWSFPQPTDQGFDVAYNDRGVQSHMDRQVDFATTNPSDPYHLDGNGFATDSVTEETLNFFTDAASSDQPFFCYYATWLVHGPWQVRTESLLQKYAERMGYSYPLGGTEVFAEGQNNPYLAAMVESFDYYVSRLLDYLKTTDDPRWPGHKLIENTYVVLTSDNGGMERGDAQGKVTDNFPLDQGKIWIKEGGTRVPFIVAGPGIAANTISDVVINGMDLYPTFLSLAGADIPDGLDASDLSSLWLNDPQDSAQITDPWSGTERDSMFWHFPHSGRVATTLLKDGWKLYKNYDAGWESWDSYSLYQLYDSNGDPLDVGEQVDLIDSETAVAAALIPEMEAWIDEVDARPKYLNPERPDMPLADQSPQILSTGNDETMAWVTWNTDRAKVKYLDLLYCKNPTGKASEEWFKIPVPFTHTNGWAEVEIPEGAEAFLFNLIDENDYFVSSVYLTGHTGYDSEVVPLREVLPQGTAAFADAGTGYPTHNVLFGNTAGDAARSVRDDVANLQMLGQTFTVTEPVRLSALTLQAYTGFNIGSTDAAELYLWIGKYESGAPADDPFRTRLYQKIDMRGVSSVAGNYYTIDFNDTVLTNGTYAFQLKWKEQASRNNSYWMYSDGSGTYADGGLLHIKTAAGTVLDFPFADSETAGSDLVFALHGTTDNIDEWIKENGFGRVRVENPYDNNIASGDLRKNSALFTKITESAWKITDGVLSNTSTSDDKIGEGAVARVIDLTDLDETDRAQLSLSFDYTTGDAAEKLYVHLWGYEELSGGSNPSLINLGAQNGNAWVGGDANMVGYNLGKPDGIFTGTPGSGSDAAAILTGSTGAQRYRNTFDVSSFTTAPDAVSEYDYLVLAFAREVGGTATPSVSISNLRLSVAGGAGLLPRTDNNAPVATADSVTVDEDSSVVITLTGSDVDGDSLSYTVVNGPANGSFDGTTYTPYADYNGSDSFTFFVNDGMFDSAEATVSITVNAVNDVPVAHAGSAEVDEDSSVAIALVGSDVDGDSLTYAVATAPVNGTFLGGVYTPYADFNGSDSFSFVAHDGTVDSAKATVSITVNPVNDAPRQVRLVTPSDELQLVAAEDAVLAAVAEDIDGTVVAMEYFVGDVKLGEDTAEPFVFKWNNMPVGEYSLSVVAMDDGGLSTTSSVNRVMVQKGENKGDGNMGNKHMAVPGAYTVEPLGVVESAALPELTNGPFCAGTLLTDAGEYRAWFAVNGATNVLGTLGGINSYAFGLSESGELVGAAETADGSFEAFRFDGSRLAGNQKSNAGKDLKLKALHSVNGADWAMALDVNDRAEVAGTSGNAFGELPVVWAGSKAKALESLSGDLGRNNAINAAGLSVGWSAADAGVLTAVIWDEKGSVTDLNALLVADSGWVLEEALLIDDHGVVVGNGVLDGELLSFVLLPQAQEDNIGHNQQDDKQQKDRSGK